jgi:NADH-quinone oxidoreductase subunit N
VQGLNEQLSGIRESFIYIIPELILACATLVVLIAGLFGNKRNRLFNFIALLSAACSMTIIIQNGLQSNIDLFNHLLQRDGFADFLMVLVDMSVLLTCLMSLSDSEKNHQSEYYALLLAIALGSHLLLMSTNLVMVFLSLELISISSYVLAGYSFDKAGSEGSLKYFLFGSIAAAVMLYGFSLLYGFTGTFDFTSNLFFDKLADEASPLLLIAGFMGLSGFLFKMAAVPMQPWAPDVYEAAPIPVIAFLSVAPKLAALGILTKFVLAMHLFGQGKFDWQLIIAAISILTILVGNLAALWQKNPKRMMAYSSIAQSGFLLIGIAAFLPQGLNYMLFYGAVYLLMNFSVFAFLLYFEKHGFDTMLSYSGAGRTFVWSSVGLTVAMVALTGLPPTSGFTAKLFIFSSLWESYLATHKTLLIWLLIIGLLNTVISLFFYLRIPYFAYLKAGAVVEVEKKGHFENLLGFILVVLVVIIFFIPGLLMGLINRINFVL